MSCTLFAFMGFLFSMCFLCAFYVFSMCFLCLILKVWGDALQTITSHKASSPPTLKSWWFYRWNRFRQRTDKWGLLQWYLVILGIIACVLFSSLNQNRVMDLDRTNRIFYKKVIMDEKRKRNYQELGSLILSDSFFKTYWGLNN